MSTLHDRLTDLAEDAPTPATGDDLWGRGRRYARRRRTGTAVIVAAAVLALVGIASAAWVRTPHDVAPAEPGRSLQLPDRLYQPSPWLPGTDETGPIGPVVALVGAIRGSGGTGVAGVSTSGAYTFLDLEDWANPAAWPLAVSPDGRWVAYRLAGDPSGEPNTMDGPDAIVGVGVYDTVSGDTERYVVPTEHGLQVDELVWGGSTLWLDYLQYDGGGKKGSARMPLDDVSGLAWDLEDGRQRELTGREMPETYGGTSEQDALVTVDGRRLVTSTLDQPGAKGLPFDVRVEAQAVVDPSGGHIAIQGDTDKPDVASSKAEPLLIATPGSDALRTTRVPGQRVDVVLGWRDEQHVVVQRYRTDDGAYQSMDVETGEMERLLVPTPENYSPGTVVPQDVWAAPQFHAPAPPEPMSPVTKATLAGAGVATVVVAVGALVLWRRRVGA